MQTVGQVRRGKWPIMALAEPIAISASVQSWIRQGSGCPMSLQSMCGCRSPLAALVGMHRCCCCGYRCFCKLQNCRCDGSSTFLAISQTGLTVACPRIFIHACFAFISG